MPTNRWLVLTSAGPTQRIHAARHMAVGQDPCPHSFLCLHLLLLFKYQSCASPAEWNTTTHSRWTLELNTVVFKPPYPKILTPTHTVVLLRPR